MDRAAREIREKRRQIESVRVEAREQSRCPDEHEDDREKRGETDRDDDEEALGGRGAQSGVGASHERFAPSRQGSRRRPNEVVADMCDNVLTPGRTVLIAAPS